jgi:hypothetical protein
MLAYLVVSLITGLTCAAVSLLGFGAGFWTVVLWYVLGCWAGFAGSVAVAVYLLGGAGNAPTGAQWPDRSAIR